MLRSRLALPLLVALPALVIAAAGVFHPVFLTPDTAERWRLAHLVLLPAFPLLAGSVLVLLRDPVDRFVSALRLAATRATSPWPYPVPMTVQTFSGFYADQLAMWAHHVGRSRLHVMVYEAVRADPQRAVDEAVAIITDAIRDRVQV